MRRLGWMTGFLTATALASTPALPQARAISQGERAQGAQAHPQLLQEFGGAFTGPQAAYVERVGKRVAVQSGLSNAQNDFTVTLLDSPVENAFAIPGGYVYITRQLLALMNSEAELAAVMGHEVGHVAARHSQKRNTRSTLGSLLAAGVGAWTGSDIVTRLAGAGAQLYALGYSRSQEYEADTLGVRFASGAGYAPIGMANALAQLNAEQALDGRVEGRAAQAAPTWMSTHPNGADRVRRAADLARQVRSQAPAGTQQDVTYLRMLDGMPYDDNPQAGVVDGATFRHPALRLQFTAPQGYTINNGSDAVSITGSGGQAQFKIGAAASDLGSFIQQQFRALGASGTPQVRATRIGGFDGAAGTVRATSGGRTVDATISAFPLNGGTGYFVTLTPAGSGVGAFAPLLSSAQTLSAAAAAQIRGKRIRIHTVRSGDTVDTLARQMAYPDFQRERFVTLNGLEAGRTLAPGTLVKLVVAG